MLPPSNQFGPIYPDLGATVAKHRRKAKDGLHVLTKDERAAYGLAVETAIRAKQRSELQRELPSISTNSSSGTWLSDGAALHAHMRKKIAAEHAAATSRERKAFATSEKQGRAYRRAMDEKRAREAQREAA